MANSKRPDEDDYYWYLDPGASSVDWRPVAVKEGRVLFIGTTDTVAVDELEGSFVKMGRPIPFWGTISVDE